MTCAHQWPDADTEKLKALWERGLSGTQISRKFGGKYSRCAILGKADRIGLAARSSTMNRHLTGERTKPTRRPEPKPVPPPIPEELPQAVGPIGHFPKGDTCRYIAGDVREEWRCCGHEGFPYCPAHHALCRVPAKSQSGK